MRSLLVLVLLCATTAQAQLFERDPGDEIVQPDEEKLQLPSAPAEENLLAFDPGFVSPLSYYIDTASLKVGGEDRIVRYTLVIKSDSGASNVTYEGLRCDTFEKKIYAYGDPKGAWSLARDPKWKPFDSRDMYRKTLFDSYFCPRSLVIGSPREGIEALQNGGHARSRNDW